MKQAKKEYQHIKKAERLEISILLKRGYSQNEIAKELGRSKSTISDEVKNNSVKGKYDPCKANQKAKTRRKNSKYQGMKVVKNIKLRDYVENKLTAGWSPEEISGRIGNIDNYLPYVSPKGVYKFVYSPYGRSLERYLRHKGKKKGQKYTKVTQLTNRIFIDQRPSIIGEKQRFGDWEGDFIVSGKKGKGVLLVLYERKSMYVIIRKIACRQNWIINYQLKAINNSNYLNSLTLDNDIAFKKHQELSKTINTPIYFCHPYHSWEKGGVENINKLIREYIPKSSDISKYSQEYIKKIESKLNNRPRKGLNYRTPLEVMLENNQFRLTKHFDTISLNLIKQKTAQVFGLRG